MRESLVKKNTPECALEASSFLDQVSRQSRLAFSLIQRAPFDISTEEGRSKERYRRVALTTVASILSKGVGLLITVIAVPLTLGYLGAERFGLWATLSSLLVVVLGFADLGLGVGLVNVISHSFGSRDHASAQISVSNTFLILVAQSFVILMLFIVASPFIDWGHFFSLKTETAIWEVRGAVSVAFFFLIAGLPFVIVQRIQEGYQEGYLNNIWQSAGSSIGLVLLVLVVHLRLGLPWLVAALIGSSVSANIANFAFQVFFVRPWLRPRIRSMNFKISGDLLRTGAVFFALNIMTMLGFNVDNLIISNILGATAVAEFSVVQKLSMLAFAYWAFLIPLWPAYGEAIARNDIAWIRKTIKRTLFISVGGGMLVGSVLIAGGPWIVQVWLGAKIVPEFNLFLAFSALIMVQGVVGVMTAVCNSNLLFKKQFLSYLLATVVALLLKITLVSHAGTSSVVWATVVSYAIFYIIPAGALVRKTFWNEARK